MTTKNNRRSFSFEINAAAGNAFFRAYQNLQPGEKSTLQRDDPLTCESFWTCMNAANQAMFNKGINEPAQMSMELIFAAAMPLLSIKEDHFSFSGRGVGELLRASSVSPRRMEAVMSEVNLIALVESLESVFRIGKLSHIDFGKIIHDLVRFDQDALATRRAWARILFSTQPKNEVLSTPSETTPVTA